MRKFPFFRQHDSSDCGPSCLRMISAHYGRRMELYRLRDLCFANRNGVTMLGISDAAEKVGFRTMGIRTSFDRLQKDVILPCIIHWRQDHFAVVYKIKVRKKGEHWMGKIYVADPAFGLLTYSVSEFLDGWLSTVEDEIQKGMVLMLSPTLAFYHPDDDLNESKKYSLIHFFSYIRPHKKLFFQVMLGMLMGMLIQLLFPFITQSMVDFGVLGNNLNFIILVLVAQFILSLSQLSVGFVQSWILLHVTTRINVALISDFITKMLKLPINFFESKKTGDIMQRIGDHSRIQEFFTGTSLGTLFSFLNFFVFAIVLGYYNYWMLVCFVIGHAIYVGWVMLFLGIRRELDFKRFEKAARNQSSIIQLISGAEEIKLNGCERKVRWKWENIQAELFDVSIKGLTVSQIQSIGAFFISNALNIGMSVFSAYLVIKGEITLGMMMSLSYILGQLKGPVENFIGFVHSYQDAKISLERLGEVHFREDEDQMNEIRQKALSPGNRDLVLKDLTFSYLGASSLPVLDHLNLVFPHNKVTAIVGESGSGKTTILKMLLGYYEPLSGCINIGVTNLKNIDTNYWRSICGVVMQDGFIFSDTIAENIAVGEEQIDIERLYVAAQIANIHEFIEELPSGYNTKIGQEGSGLSQGQKQRILIARAVYKNPQYIFLDEATNALDANNERAINDNLHDFYQGRTVIVVAHRLSTVRNADKIVVLDHGKIVSEGTHEQLVAERGYYYELVKNQLEMVN
ncbi:peptidase domain-containing ABC transporter [Parabacteroides sp. AM08-6]|uniref:peptidase domain-containing ABC transporter n=1 Tax=Parabacteroides sp. AM08-6 TaxID=2292053 RepID=UPI000EFDF25D|nr:peptidase domain-containing ABC transporter [Parabacteroides sp. AM08-6]RHJ81515.1 peptidase domain-containing ABC transporter [Parabacteroides sp. AM08-6]